MWHVNAYIIEKRASAGYWPISRRKEAMRVLAYTHMRIVSASGGRMRYVHYARIRMLTVRVRKAYAYMRGWRAHNRARTDAHTPRPYLRLLLLLDYLLW